MAPVVNPPAARATPEATSMPIQMPQGTWLFRLATFPMPKRKRAARKPPPVSRASLKNPVTPMMPPKVANRMMGAAKYWKSPCWILSVSRGGALTPSFGKPMVSKGSHAR